MRKSGGGTSSAPAHNEPAVNPSNNDIDMDEDLDPAAMYEDEEGKCIDSAFGCRILGLSRKFLNGRLQE